MATLCARCRQVLDGDPRLHDCPEDDGPDEGSGEAEAA